MNKATKLLTFILCLISVNLYSQQDNNITEKYFPNPKTKFNTPSNLIEGPQFASYNQIIEWINGNCTNNYTKIEYIGTTPKGLSIPMIILSDNPENAKNINNGKLRIWMQGALHGNEPAGAEGLFALIDYINNNKSGRKLLKYADIAILPIANMDGYLANNRKSSDGYDLNRDQTKFADPVSIIIKRAFVNWNANLSFDFHEFQPTRKELDYVIDGKSGSTPFDVLFLLSGHPNVAKEIKYINKNILERDAVKALDKLKYTHNYYFSISNAEYPITIAKGAKSPQSSSTSYALTNSASILVEIRGIKLDKISFARRTNAAFTVARSFIESAIKNKNEIKALLTKAKEETADSIFVKGNTVKYNSTLPFIDLRTHKLVDCNVIVADADSIVPTIKRTRPYAYIFENISQKELENLNTLGIKVDKLDNDKTYNVEGFEITDIQQKKEWEKITPITVKTKIIKQVKTFKAGSYIVYLNQRMSNVAISILEPESDNGFVSFRVSNVSLGKIHNVYRITNL